jgi:hypothetical protein
VPASRRADIVAKKSGSWQPAQNEHFSSIFRGGPDIAVPGRDAELVEPPTVLKSGWLRLICRPLDQSPRRW